MNLPVAPVGKQAPPALRYARLVTVAPLRAGPSHSLPGQLRRHQAEIALDQGLTRFHFR